MQAPVIIVNMFLDQLSTCQPEEFRCAMGECIPIAWQCDGEKDCPEEDALDEWDRLCSKFFFSFGIFKLVFIIRKRKMYLG